MGDTPDNRRREALQRVLHTLRKLGAGRSMAIGSYPPHGDAVEKRRVKTLPAALFQDLETSWTAWGTCSSG